MTDHLNTVRDLAALDNETGVTTIANHIVYDAFGRVTGQTDPTVMTLFAFTARPFDRDTGLQNNLNRWYDAETGTWISEDPKGFAAADVNVYRYAGNCATIFVDPTGEDRRLIIFFGHLGMEVQTELGSVFLDFNPSSFLVVDPYFDLGAIPASAWVPSTREQDQQLIELWETLEEERKKGNVQPWMNWLPNHYVPSNPLWNCWSPILMFLHYPDVVAPKAVPPNTFPPGWNPQDHSCWNYHAPEVKAWLRTTPLQRQDWQWPPRPPKPPQALKP